MTTGWPLLMVVAALVAILSQCALAGRVEIVRDVWGVPHISAATDAEAAYGLGYAQAEDRLEQLLRNYRLAGGTLAEAFGPEHVESDRIQRLMGHLRTCRERYGELSADARELIEAFQAGVRRFMSEHPEKVPSWAPEIEPAMAVALGRNLIFNWPLGTGFEELGRKDPEFRFASNEWALAPSKTADGSTILCTDPHIGWDGPFRFYEFRLHGDTLHVSGFGPVGAPIVSLGHNERVAWAATTGGPDTADVFIEQLDPDNPGRYLYDGESLPFETREETINVAGADPVTVAVMRSLHGVVLEVDEEKGLAYAFATPYLDEIGPTDQFLAMNRARDAAEFKAALTMLQLMEQNIMYADADGNIGYCRVGRVPVRAPGYDYSKPVPGNTSATAWRGIHPLEDLVQVENPPTGYMQNCNISPEHLAKVPLIDRAAYPPYVLNVTWDTLNSRGARALERLSEDRKFTVEDAMDICLDARPYGALAWAQATIAAAEARPDHPGREKVQGASDLIGRWDGRLVPDAVGPALLALQWRSLADAKALFTRLVFEGGEPTSEEQDALLSALAAAVDTLMERKGRIDVPWGELFVVARGEHSAPVVGGELGSIEALRAVGFEFNEERFRFVGTHGSSWTQLIVFRNGRLESWSVTPWGQSDDPASPHYFDQAALYCKPEMKPTWFRHEEAREHAEGTLVLEY